MKQFNTRTMVIIGAMSAIAVVLFAFEVVIIAPIKMDFSDLPVMVTGYLFGFPAGIFVAAIKNIIHLFFFGSDAPVVGQVANFSYAVLIMAPFVLIKAKNLKMTVVTALVAVAISTVGMLFLNYFIMLPWYGMTDPDTRWAFALTVTNINLVKGTVLGALFTIIKPQIDRLK